MADDKEILEMIKEIGAMVREEEKNIESANNIIKRMEEGAGKDILKATLGTSEDTLIKYKCLINWLVELRARRNVERWMRVEDGAIPDGSFLILCEGSGVLQLGEYLKEESKFKDALGNEIEDVVAWALAPKPYEES